MVNLQKYVLIEKICSEYVEFIKSIVMKYLLSYFIVGLTLLGCTTNELETNIQ